MLQEKSSILDLELGKAISHFHHHAKCDCWTPTVLIKINNMNIFSAFSIEIITGYSGQSRISRPMLLTFMEFYCRLFI